MKLKVAFVAAVLLCGTSAVAAALLGATAAPPAGADEKCVATDARIVVSLEKHALLLCDKGKVIEAIGVRLGRGGIGKTREGDGKTPVGTYPLGEPRPSNRYGTFIPIGFPTDEQKKAGYTGSAVGVHGPPRWVKWLGRLVNTFDSSDGCVGVARDDEIERIAAWVRAAPARTIELR
jgi:murein L,D-transpeptidase YafK